MPSPRPSLAELQKGLYEVFTDPRGARAAAAARPAALSWIAPQPPADAPTRLSVYGDGYFLRLFEVLSDEYKAVRRALGEMGFRILAAEYLAANPSASPTLGDLGEAFPAFAARHSLSRDFPFLGDLARLERAALTRLLTERLPALDPAAVGRVPADAWGRAKLTLDPT
ncbi:MAG TPA: DNA-binding domain-containing protein, partial [Elusimicrobiota bacterium]|nr:DNA-binding domain-containing protein [Elusimicrobiota bacterium]